MELLASLVNNGRSMFLPITSCSSSSVRAKKASTAWLASGDTDLWAGGVGSVAEGCIGARRASSEGEFEPSYSR